MQPLLHIPRMPRIVVFAILTVVGSLLFSACTAGAPGAAPVAEDEPIELVWLDVCAPITTPITDMLIEKFESENPNVTVTVECSQGDYAEGIYAKAAAGNLPDLMFSADLFTVPFVENGVLVDLEAFASVDDSFTFDDIYPNILGLGQVVGTPGTYMIPASWDSVQMYYNKDMFSEAGAPLPTDDWSWADLYLDRWNERMGLVGLFHPLDRRIWRRAGQRGFLDLDL